MKIIELEQGAQDWLLFRRTHVTATDMGVINKTNPYTTVHQLLGRKLGVIAPQADNERMAEGRALESEARNLYNLESNSNYKPLIIESDELPWVMASLDGYYDGNVIEIKCGVRSYEDMLIGTIAPYYYDQMQTQMYCAGISKMTYICYRPGEKLLTQEVTFDKKYFKKILKKAEAFYTKMVTTQIVKDEKALALADWLKEARVKRKEWEEKEKALQKELYELLPESDCFCGVLSIRTTTKKGAIDWKSLGAKYNISEEEEDRFRKAGVSYRQIVVI